MSDVYITILADGTIPATQYKSNVFSTLALLSVVLNVPDVPGISTLVMVGFGKPKSAIDLLRSL